MHLWNPINHGKSSDCGTNTHQIDLETYHSGVARRRKVGGGGHKLFFPTKCEKQKKKKKKSHSGVKAQDRVLWIGEGL